MDVFNRGPRDRGDQPSFVMRPSIPGLKTILTAAAVLVGLTILFSLLLRVTRIEAGHVGVEINLAGKQRGASEIPVRTGWVAYSPLTTQIIEFPTYVQTVSGPRIPMRVIPLTKRWASTPKRAWKFLSTSHCRMPLSLRRPRIST